MFATVYKERDMGDNKECISANFQGGWLFHSDGIDQRMHRNGIDVGEWKWRFDLQLTLNVVIMVVMPLLKNQITAMFEWKVSSWASSWSLLRIFCFVVIDSRAENLRIYDAVDVDVRKGSDDDPFKTTTDCTPVISSYDLMADEVSSK